MLFCPEKYKKFFPDVNKQLSKLTGELEDKEAQITFAQFLRANLGFAIHLISGFEPLLYQEILLKACMNRNYTMIVGARGASKSTIASVLAFIIPIFEPNTNVLIAAPTFRSSRAIFNGLERMTKSKEGVLLRQCFSSHATRRADEFMWELNGGIIRSIPLSGDKIRGFRAQVLILDEFLLLSKDIVDNVLTPFLIIPSDIKGRMKIVAQEDELIQHGVMKKSDRTQFKSKARMIALTSASYTFENAYQVYKQWETEILSNEPVENATYSVFNISYEVLPTWMVEKGVIEEAKRGEELHPAFKREYCAQFVDGSDGYFSAKKMHQLTVKDGEHPTVLIKGNPKKKYILAIDPNWSQGAAADFFAMAVLELNEEDESCILVHNYGEAGVELKKHIQYFYYLLNAFNIVLVVADNMDGNFIQSANESTIFQSNNLKLNELDYDGSLEGQEYVDMLRKVRTQYNLNEKKICFKHIFNQKSIQRMNEQLQTYINTNRIYFGSKLVQVNEDYDKAIKGTIPYPFEDRDTTAGEMAEFIYDVIANQDRMVYEVKKQCALIEVKVSPTGGQSFDLPASLKRNNTATRARRDNYTALLLGVEGVKSYFHIMKQPTKAQVSTFIPTLFGSSTFRNNTE